MKPGALAIEVYKCVGKRGAIKYFLKHKAIIRTLGFNDIGATIYEY